MKTNLLKLTNFTTLLLAGGIGFVVPLLYTTNLGEFFLLPKQLVIYAAVALLVVIIAIRYFAEGVRLRIDSLTLPLVLLIIFAFASSYFGTSRLSSLTGGLPPTVGLILFYLLLIQVLPAIEDKKGLYSALYAVLASGTLLALWRILNFFEVYLPFVDPVTKTRAFTPVGSGNSLAVLLVMLIPLNIALLAKAMSTAKMTNIAKIMYQIGYLAVLSVSLLLVGTALILTAPMFTLYLVGLVVLIMLAFMPAELVKRVRLPLLSICLILVVVGVAFHVPFTANKVLLDKVASFPIEPQLDLRTSWVVAVHAVRDFPFFGSGLGTFLSDFSSYRPVAYNATPYWNVRFGNAGNGFLQLLATLGLVGLLAFLYFVGRVIKVIRSEYLGRDGQSVDNLEDTAIKVGVGAALTAYLGALLLAVPNFPVEMIFFLLLAVGLGLFGHSLKSLAPSFPMDDGRDALPFVTIGPAIILAAAILYLTGRYAYADYLYRTGVSQAVQQKAQESFNTFRQAVQTNPYRDSYHTSLAVLTFSLADSIAAKGKDITKDEQDSLLQLLDFSIKEAKNAVALDPANIDNWYTLASMYRNIAGLIQNSGDWAVATYKQAILMDPINPILRMDLGGLYYLAGDYESASNYFREAATLKDDYANAHFNLAYAYRQKNMIPAAYNEMAYVTRLVPTDSTDYKRAFDDLETLRKLLPADAQAQLPSSVTPTGSNLEVTPTPTPELKVVTPSAKLAQPTKSEKIALPEASPSTQPTP